MYGYETRNDTNQYKIVLRPLISLIYCFDRKTPQNRFREKNYCEIIQKRLSVEQPLPYISIFLKLFVKRFLTMYITKIKN